MTSIAEQRFEGSTPVRVASRPDYTLFDSRAVALATFLGTAVAGSLLIALNYRRLGRSGAALTAAILGVVATALLLMLVWNLPRGVSSVIAFGVMFALKYIAKSLQGAAVAAHVQNGGALGSQAKALLLGGVMLAAIFGAVFLVIYTQDHQPSVVIGTKDEVFYSGSATKEQAQALGNALKASGYFGDRGADVLLTKGKNGTKVQFIIKEGSWKQLATVEQFEIVGQQIATSVGGYPIKVDLLNKERDVQTDSNVGQVVVNEKDDVYYLGDATETEAKALSEALKSDGFFTGRGSDVFLSKHADGTMLSFVVSAGVWDKPESVKNFENVVREVAPAVGGSPVKLRLVNTSLETKKEETP